MAVWWLPPIAVMRDTNGMAAGRGIAAPGSTHHGFFA